jgi:hypothetical protein
MFDQKVLYNEALDNQLIIGADILSSIDIFTKLSKYFQDLDKNVEGQNLKMSRFLFYKHI